MKEDTNTQPDYEEILSYAKKVRMAYPSISDEDLQNALSARFIGGKDALPLATVGIVCNPLADYLSMLSIVFNSLRKVITQDKNKLLLIQDRINQAVAQLSVVH